MSARNCGECSACCFTHAIVDLSKRNFTSCANQCSFGGCLVYNTSAKPQECTDFSCAWLKGSLGTDTQRPDLSGLVSVVYEAASDVPAQVHIYEAIPGAALDSKNWPFLLGLMNNGYILRVSSPQTSPISQFHVHVATPGAADIAWNLGHNNKVNLHHDAN